MKKNLLVLVVVITLAFSVYGYGINVIISSAITQKDCSISVVGSVNFTPQLPATAATIDFIPATGASVRLATNIPLGVNGAFQWSGPVTGYPSIPAGSNVKVTTNRQISATAPLKACSPFPTVVPSSSNPPVPSGLKIACFTGPDSSVPGPCQVLQWNGYTYWAFSYIDNRIGMAIVAYDAKGNIVKTWEKTGARYLYKIAVDNTAQTVTFWGQTNLTINMTWNDLSIPPTVVPNSCTLTIYLLAAASFTQAPVITEVDLNGSTPGYTPLTVNEKVNIAPKSATFGIFVGVQSGKPVTVKVKTDDGAIAVLTVPCDTTQSQIVYGSLKYQVNLNSMSNNAIQFNFQPK